MSIELKPCPFCGGEAQIKHRRYFDDNASYAECEDCHAVGRSYQLSYEYSSDEEAAKAWNERVPSQNLKVVSTVYGDNQPVISYETDGKDCHNCKHFEDLITTPVGFSCKHCSRFHLDRYEEDKDE